MMQLIKHNEEVGKERTEGGGSRGAGDELVASFVQNSAVATFVIDVGHRVLYWNAACEELTGVKAAQVVGTGDHWKAFYGRPTPCAADLVIEDELDGKSRYHCGYSRSVLVGSGLHTERSYRQLGGKPRFVTFDAAPIRDARGRLAAAVETLQDMTEMKESQEQALRAAVTRTEYVTMQREQKYMESILNVMPISLIVLNPDGRIRSVNPRTCDFLGRSREELIGESLAEVIGEEAMAKSIFWGRGLEKLLDKGSVHDMLMEYLPAAGKALPVTVSASTERDEAGRLEYVVVVAKDMREIHMYASERLAKLTSVLEKVAMGDFSQSIAIDEKEDEFTEHLVSLNLMISDMRETVGKNAALLKALAQEKASLEKKVEERTANLDEANKRLSASNLRLENSNRQLAAAQEQLLEKVGELEIFNKMTMGREIKILELKDEVVRLQTRTAEDKP
jgi:PAS domain S-box-containing protein